MEREKKIIVELLAILN